MRIKDFVPPVVAHQIRKMRARPSEIFSSYQDAAASCGNQGYEEETLVTVMQHKTDFSSKRIAQQSPFSTQGYTIEVLLGLNYAGHRAGKTELNVIDFGGACGIHYFTVNAFFKNSIKLRWHVVETPAMVRKGREKFETENLRFFESVQEAQSAFGDTVDVALSSGALQYVPDPCHSLETLASCGASVLLLTRAGLRGDGQDIVSIQESLLSENGLGPIPDHISDRKVRYPITFVSRTKFEKSIEKKFKIRARFTEMEQMYTVLGENIPGYGYIADRLVN